MWLELVDVFQEESATKLINKEIYILIHKYSKVNCYDIISTETGMCWIKLSRCFAPWRCLNLSLKKLRRMEPKKLDELVSASIDELELYRANRANGLVTTGELLEYMIEMLRQDREKSRIKQPPTSQLLGMMCERKHTTLKVHKGALFKHTAKTLREYAKFVDHADGKQETRKWASQAEDLRDFLKEFRSS